MGNCLLSRPLPYGLTLLANTGTSAAPGGMRNPPRNCSQQAQRPAGNTITPWAATFSLSRTAAGGGGDWGTYAHHLQPSEAHWSHRGAASGDTGLWKGQCLWMLAARHVLSLCHRLVPGPAAAQGLSDPKPELPALCTHTRAHGVNSSTSSLYEPSSPQLSCTGRESRGKAPSSPPEPC